MKSKFHVSCTAPEELRTELLQWLLTRAISAQDYAEHTARTKQAQLVSFTEARVYREIAQFWGEIVIEDPQGDSQGIESMPTALEEEIKSGVGIFDPNHPSQKDGMKYVIKDRM